jgi:hypothetical protein
MTQPDAAAAWRLFCFTWWPLGLAALMLAGGLAVSNFTLGLAGVIVTVVFVSLYAGFAIYNARAVNRRDPQVVFALGATAQVVLTTMVMTPMTYFAAATNFPMQDANLLAIDRAIGIDWLAYVRLVNDHPALAGMLSYGYTMIAWPVFGIPVILAAARRYRRLQEFTLAFLLSLIATTIISALVPAIGVFDALGLDPASFANLDPGAYLLQLRDLPQVRDGSLRALNLLSLGGIVTFPSFHAASAALYLWALWPVRWCRPIAIVANGAMLAATPISGGHYFIDLAAGVAVAAAAIIAARQIGDWLVRRAPAEQGAVPDGVPAE